MANEMQLNWRHEAVVTRNSNPVSPLATLTL